MKLIDDIIANHRNDLVFLIGNGINKQILGPGNAIAWTDMLKETWETIYGKNRFPFEYQNENDRATLAMLEIGELTMGKLVDVKKHICEKLKEQNNIRQCHLLAELQASNTPILTTNYDLNMEMSLGLCRFIMPGTKKGDGFTPSYPWNLYYANAELQTPLDGFAIWHIHGICSYPQSLALSTMDYVDMIKRAYKRIEGAVNIFNLKNQNEFDLGENTWLKLFFEKSLCIVGLGMSQNEIFLRWLLIQRKLYYWVKHRKTKPIYFLCHENDTLTAYDKDFFNLVGVEIRGFKDFDAIYN